MCFTKSTYAKLKLQETTDTMNVDCSGKCVKNYLYSYHSNTYVVELHRLIYSVWPVLFTLFLKRGGNKDKYLSEIFKLT